MEVVLCFGKIMSRYALAQTKKNQSSLSISSWYSVWADPFHVVVMYDLAGD